MLNIIHKDGMFEIQKINTEKDDFIVRVCGREEFRTTDKGNALNWIQTEKDKRQKDSEYWQSQNEIQKNFDKTIPDLNRAQLRWQEWRNWFYDTMQYYSKNLDKAQKVYDKISPNSSSFSSKQHYLAQDTEEMLNAEEFYREIIALDTRIKDARREKDGEKLAMLLIETDDVIRHMNGYFLSSARPDDAKPHEIDLDKHLRRSTIMLPEYQWSHLEKRAVEVTGERKKKTSMAEYLRELIDKDMGR